MPEPGVGKHFDKGFNRKAGPGTDAWSVLVTHHIRERNNMDLDEIILIEK